MKDKNKYWFFSITIPLLFILFTAGPVYNSLFIDPIIQGSFIANDVDSKSTIVYYEVFHEDHNHYSILLWSETPLQLDIERSSYNNGIFNFGITVNEEGIQLLASFNGKYRVRIYQYQDLSYNANPDAVYQHFQNITPLLEFTINPEVHYNFLEYQNDLNKNLYGIIPYFVIILSLMILPVVFNFRKAHSLRLMNEITNKLNRIFHIITFSLSAFILFSTAILVILQRLSNPDITEKVILGQPLYELPNLLIYLFPIYFFIYLPFNKSQSLAKTGSSLKIIICITLQFVPFFLIQPAGSHFSSISQSQHNTFANIIMNLYVIYYYLSIILNLIYFNWLFSSFENSEPKNDETNLEIDKFSFNLGYIMISLIFHLTNFILFDIF